VTVKGDRRLWAIFAVVAGATFVVRSEVAILFIVAGLVGVLLLRAALPAVGQIRTAASIRLAWRPS